MPHPLAEALFVAAAVVMPAAAALGLVALIVATAMRKPAR
jgi:hypothetical protein